MKELIKNKLLMERMFIFIKDIMLNPMLKSTSQKHLIYIKNFLLIF